MFTEGVAMLITAQLFTGTGWSDPTLVEEINTRNVMHGGKLYSYLFHRRDGQVKDSPVTHRVRKQLKGVLNPHRRLARPKAKAVKATMYPTLEQLPPIGVVGGPYSLLELDMADSLALQVSGKVVKCRGKQWVVRA